LRELKSSEPADLGESLGEASSANTFFKSSRWFSQTRRDAWHQEAGDLTHLIPGLMKPEEGFVQVGSEEPKLGVDKSNSIEGCELS